MSSRYRSETVAKRKTAGTARKPSRKASAGKGQALLVNFRPKDSPLGVRRETVRLVAEQLGMKETELVHLALVSYMRDHVRTYPEILEALTPAEHDEIDRLSPKGAMVEVVESLY